MIAASQPLAVAGGFQSGNDILSHCTPSPTDFEQGFCDGYTGGVADAMGAEEPIFGWRACFPRGVTGGQITDAAVRYLQLHIGDRHKGAASLVAAALAETFPCGK